MAPNRFDLVRSIATEALTAPFHDRNAIIDHRCGGDPSLRDEVLRAIHFSAQANHPSRA